MVSTPKTSSSIINDPKLNIMPQYQSFSQYSQYINPASIESSQMKSGASDSDFYELIELIMGNDVLAGDFFQPESQFQSETSTYNISPEFSSSLTTPTSLVLDGGISTPQDITDSPIFNHNTSFASSPALDPPTGFFPDLSDPNASVPTRSLMHLAVAPSVTIPVDDSPITTIPGSSAPSPALNIPWSTDAQNSSSLAEVDVSSPFSPTTSISNATSPSIGSIKSNSRNRKRNVEEVDKDPQTMADELAMKRAKNTDAARRSRLRKVQKMELLEKQVAELKAENNDLQTRIAVLESEKKGLEDKNAEKEARVNMLEQQLAEAHERLIKRT